MVGAQLDVAHATSAAALGAVACDEARPSLQKIQKTLEALLVGAISGGHNFSLLLLGDHGVGKTMVLDAALKNIDLQFNKQPNNAAFLVVRLDGAVHSDDRLAFQEMARQLCRGMNSSFSQAAAFDQNIDFLRDILKHLQCARKSVVFVLDELDQYVRRSKQLVLYNLLDALQHGEVQAAFIGVTACHDVKELMEKRVRSRLSDRKIVVPPLGKEAGERPQDLLQGWLSLPAVPDPDDNAQAVELNASLAAAMDQPRMQAGLQRLSAYGRSPRYCQEVALRALMRARLASGDSLDVPVQLAHVMEDMNAHESLGPVVAQLSVLQLSLLVAMAKLDSRGQNTFNFAMVAAELLSASRQHNTPAPRPLAAQRAFQSLVHARLARHVAPTGRVARTQGTSAYLATQLLVSSPDLRAGIEASSCPDWLRSWAFADGTM